MKNILHSSNIKSFKKIYQGKVRDIYEIDEDNILIISTDRVSVFDVILPTPIPKKGIIFPKRSITIMRGIENNTKTINFRIKMKFNAGVFYFIK